MARALMIAAPASGQGKTTATCAVAAALADRGLRVRLAKAGPDFLDPTWHRAVSGHPSETLDPWMMGEAAVREALGHLAVDADLVLVEGMMGLFDGARPGDLEGSSAALARLLDLPVVLAVDASGMAGSIRALVDGFAGHAEGVDVVGALFNRVGSTGHADLLAQALRGGGVVPLGGLPDDRAVALPERHLGLVAAEHAPQARTRSGRERLRRALVGLAAGLDLDALLDLARPVPRAVPRPAPPAPDVRVGVAMDAAFHFLYPDTLRRLRALGAEVVPFSPLGDAALPDDLGGLILCGGYPELHAAELATNDTFRASVRALARAGRPIYAECGGLVYLGEGLYDLDGAAHAFCGVLPVQAEMTERLVALGWRSVTTTRPTILGPAGTTLRGHAFHHSTLVFEPDLPTAYDVEGVGGREREGWVQDRVLASWVHVHFASAPEALARFVDACRA